MPQQGLIFRRDLEEQRLDKLWVEGQCGLRVKLLHLTQPMSGTHWAGQTAITTCLVLKDVQLYSWMGTPTVSGCANPLFWVFPTCQMWTRWWNTDLTAVARWVNFSALTATPATSHMTCDLHLKGLEASAFESSDIQNVVEESRMIVIVSILIEVLAFLQWNIWIWEITHTRLPQAMSQIHRFANNILSVLRWMTQLLSEHLPVSAPVIKSLDLFSFSRAQPHKFGNKCADDLWMHFSNYFVVVMNFEQSLFHINHSMSLRLIWRGQLCTLRVSTEHPDSASTTEWISSIASQNSILLKYGKRDLWACSPGLACKPDSAASGFQIRPAESQARFPIRQLIHISAHHWEMVMSLWYSL